MLSAQRGRLLLRRTTPGAWQQLAGCWVHSGSDAEHSSSSPAPWVLVQRDGGGNTTASSGGGSAAVELAWRYDQAPSSAGLPPGAAAAAAAPAITSTLGRLRQVTVSQLQVRARGSCVRACMRRSLARSNEDVLTERLPSFPPHKRHRPPSCPVATRTPWPRDTCATRCGRGCTTRRGRPTGVRRVERGLVQPAVHCFPGAGSLCHRSLPIACRRPRIQPPALPAAGPPGLPPCSAGLHVSAVFGGPGRGRGAHRGRAQLGAQRRAGPGG